MNVRELIDDLSASGIRLWVEADQLRFRAPRGAMTDARRETLRAHRAALVEHLRDAAAGHRARPDAAARHEPFPLTDIQAAYLVGRGSTYDYGGTACHAYVELAYPHADHEIDPDRLAAAWRDLVAAHDVLRAVVHPDGYQQVLAPEVAGPPAVPVTDLRAADEAEVAGAVARVRATLDHRTDDPARFPLCRLQLTRCPDRTLAHLSVDLLAVDFTSLAMLLDELHARYADPLAAPPVPELTFRDYVLATRGLAESARAERDRDYWWARIDDLPPAPELPVLEHTSGPARFRRLATTLAPQQYARLSRRAAAHGVPTSAVLLTAYAEVIERWSRHPRFTLNVPTFTRHPVHPDVDRLVGDFTAVELLEVDLTAAVPFVDRVRDVAGRLLEDLAHPLCTGSEVLAEVARRRGRAAALMPVVFTSALDSAPAPLPVPGAPRPQVAHALTQTPQVWIDCQVLERDGADGERSLAVSWDCREGVFPDGLLDDAFAVFADLLDRLLDADDDAAATTWASTDPVRLPAAQAARRAEIDDTAAPVPPGLLHEPVLAAAAARPDAVAVIDAGGATTYGELAARARAVAAALRSRGAGPGDLVAVVMDKGVEQVSGVLGVLLAGAAYLPVETNQPPARRNAILADSRARHAVTQSWVGDALSDWPGEVALLAVDTLPPAPPGSDAVTRADPGDLAYVIYTSGSTGTPKGVMISHEAALNTVADINSRFGVGADDRVLGLAALGFDLSVYDVFGGLAAGATLVLPDPARRGDPSHWAELVAAHGVTVWNSVPGQLQMLHDHLPSGGGSGLASLRLALLSGDWIPVTLPDQVRALVPDLEVISLGGATEGAIWSIHYPIGAVDPAWPSIPYGWPLTNQTLRVLDHRLRPRPDWVVGELYIGGTGVALGYRGDPERTAERFGVHPRTGERIYRTGDLGRHLGGHRGGVVEFLGREDTQVKIRGYRIELAEVEAALHAHPGVATGAVLVDSDTNSGHRLAAFVQPARTGGALPDATIATAAAAALDPLPADRADRIAGFVATLDDAALLAMAATLQPTGLSTDRGATSEEVCAALGALPRHHRLVRRWLRALVAAGRLQRGPDGRHSGLAPVEPGRAEQVWAELAAAERELGWSADLLDHLRACAARLPELLDGTVPVAGLLFPGAPADAVRAAYRDNLALRGLNRAAAAAVAAIARSAPRPLRVLEVGGGVGGLTAEMVPALAGLDVDYRWSDPSPFFVAEARERFADHPWVRHERFDPQLDVRAQGLLPHTVDVVVAGNALHRCADVAAVLDRLTELLTPGGRLVLVEQVRDDSPALMVSMEFLEALAGEPVDARRDTDAAFVDARGWERLVEAAGGATDVLLPAEDDPLAALGQRLLLARFKTDRARLDADGLTRHLADRLPEYMVPAHWQVLDALPYSANGKVDRAALRRLLPSAAGPPSGSAPAGPTGSGAPRDEREQELAALWAELLGCATVGRDDDFFALGGDSLLVARLVGRLRESVPALVELEWDVVLRHLLHRPTVAGLAEYLRGLDGAPAGGAAVTQARSPVVELNGTGDAATVLVHAGVGTIMPYRALITEVRRRAAGGTRLLGLEVPDLDAFLDAEPAGLIDRLAADYAGALLGTGARRFHVVGYCLGGLISTEVARSLTESAADLATFTAVSSHAPAFRLEDELLSEYSFAVMMGIDAAALGFPADSDRFVAAAEEVLARTPGVMVDGALAALAGEHADVAEHFRRLAQVPRMQRVARMCDAVPPSVGSFTPAQLLRMFRTFRQSVFALTRYHPDPYAGDIAFLRHGGPYPFPGSKDSVTRYWRDVCLGELTVTDIAGDHFTCLADDQVPAVLRHLVDITGGEVLA